MGKDFTTKGMGKGKIPQGGKPGKPVDKTSTKPKSKYQQNRTV